MYKDTMRCLPGAKFPGITSHTGMPLDGVGVDSIIMDTNDIRKCSHDVLEAKYRLLTRRQRPSIPKAAFSEAKPAGLGEL